MKGLNEDGRWEYRVQLKGASFCGPAVVVSVLRFWGNGQVSQDDVVTAAGLTTEEICREGKDVGGIPPDKMITAIRGLAPDLRVWSKLGATIDDLRQVTEAGYPAIVAWQTTDEDNVVPPPSGEDEGHYSIVTGVDEENVYISDPSSGQEKIRGIKRQFFESRWWDKNEGIEYQKLMIVVEPDVVS